MSNKVGKATVNRVDWGRWIVSSIRVHKTHLISMLVGRMGLGEVEWDMFLSGQEREMDTVTEKLWAAELGLARERSDDPAHRAERDELLSELVEELVRVRSVLDAVKPGLTGRYGLDGVLPRVARDVESFSRNVMENLLQANQTYSLVGMAISTTDLAAQIDTSYQKLQRKLVTLNDEDRKAEGLLIMRNRALGEWTRVYQVVAGMMENVYRMAGEDELARRVRPTIRRSTGKDGPEAEEAVAGDVDVTGEGGDGAVVKDDV